MIDNSTDHQSAEAHLTTASAPQPHLQPTTLNISSIDGRYHQLTAELGPIVSEQALTSYRLNVEARWLRYQITHPQLSAHLPEPATIQNHSAIMACLDQLATENISTTNCAHIKSLEQTTRHDVKAVEYYLRHVLEQFNAPASYIALIHFGCTSEDINNLAYGMMLRDTRSILLRDMNSLLDQLNQLATHYAANPMLSRTHGQPASPTTMGKELAVFSHRLHRQMEQLKHQTIFGKWSGAVGNYNAHCVAWPELSWPDIAHEFVTSIKPLKHNPMVTQIEPHDALSEYCDTLKRFDAIAIDLCRDIWSYISLNYFSQKSTDSETGSSTMPHKINPIHFENAEGNFGIARSLATHFSDKLLISRLQRDLTDSTVMRSFGTMVAHHQVAIKNLLAGFTKITLNQQAMDDDLDQAWEVLGEPLQTIMRTHGITDSYEQLKALTRGKTITQARYQQLVNQLHGLSAASRTQLLELTPHNYLGLARELATQPFCTTAADI